MEQPILVYQKSADKTTNKMIIPKAIIEHWGRDFRMEIYKDKILYTVAKYPNPYFCFLCQSASVCQGALSSLP